MAPHRRVLQGHKDAFLRAQSHPGVSQEFCSPAYHLAEGTYYSAVHASSGCVLVHALTGCVLRQVTRKWLNWEGEAVAQHFAALFSQMEADPRVQRALR